MPSEFSSEIMLTNIYYLVREKGMKIGELEAEAGVSPGYISRLQKDFNTKPGVDFILNVSAILGISIDSLLTVPLQVLTPTEEYLLKFLLKLETETKHDLLELNPESADYLNSMTAIPQPDSMWEDSPHPLFQVISDEETPSPHCVVFFSKSFGSSTIIEDQCFNLELARHSRLYLMKIRDKNIPDSKFRDETIEVWMSLSSSSSPTRFLCATNGQPGFGSAIFNLYDTVKLYSTKPKIPSDYRTVIDGFMNGTLKKVSEEEELPF